MNGGLLARWILRIRNDDLLVVLLVWLVGVLVNGIGAMAFLELAAAIDGPEPAMAPARGPSGTG